jgi:hypothetical protein
MKMEEEMYNAKTEMTKRGGERNEAERREAN